MRLKRSGFNLHDLLLHLLQNTVPVLILQKLLSEHIKLDVQFFTRSLVVRVNECHLLPHLLQRFLHSGHGLKFSVKPVNPLGNSEHFVLDKRTNFPELILVQYFKAGPSGCSRLESGFLVHEPVRLSLLLKQLGVEGPFQPL